MTIVNYNSILPTLNEKSIHQSLIAWVGRDNVNQYLFVGHLFFGKYRLNRFLNLQNGKTLTVLA